MNCPSAMHPDRPVAPGKTRCRECLDQRRDYQRKRRADRLAAGTCVGTVGRSNCDNRARKGKTMCEACAHAFNQYQNERNSRLREKR